MRSGSTIPQNPFFEHDEKYAQDGEFCHNLEDISQDQIKFKEIEKFKSEMNLLRGNDDYQSLNEGKFLVFYSLYKKP